MAQYRPEEDRRQTRPKCPAQKNTVQLLQLAASLLLFLAVFIGKGAFPHQTEGFRSGLNVCLTESPDLRTALSDLGASLADHASITGHVADFCAEVFGPIRQFEGQTAVPVFSPIPTLSHELEFLSAQPNTDMLLRHYCPAPGLPEQPEDPAPAAVGTVLEKGESCEPIPEDCSLDRISLGGLGTCVPVSGPITSAFGFRTHPISGTYSFHTGTDIAAETGTPIAALADGTVDFIGESDGFGLYIQLDHGNGIKSLYAHCSKLCASKGDAVCKGDRIAEVGSTGNSTGPHLHLELKNGDIRLDPALHIPLGETT